MTNEDEFDFDKKIRDALLEKGISTRLTKPSVLKDWFYRRLEEAVVLIQHGIVILIVILAICIFGISVLRLMEVAGISAIIPFLSFPNIGGKIMPLLIILDLCLIAITVLVLSEEIYKAFVKYRGRFGEQKSIHQTFEGDRNVLGMVVVTTSIVFLTIIMYIGQRPEDIVINDVLYLAIGIAAVITSLAVFLFVKYRKP